MDYKAVWRERTRAWAMELLGGKCAKCGGTDRLQFDHRDPANKTFTISVGIADCFSKARLETELTKCQLLCVDCHRQKTSLEQGVPHGGGKSGKRNCPCVPCRKRKREYMKAYMADYARRRDRSVSGYARINRSLTRFDSAMETRAEGPE